MTLISVDLRDILEATSFADRVEHLFDKQFDNVLQYEKEVDITVTPGTPGNYFGLPENCYPAEPAEAECDVDACSMAQDALLYLKKQVHLEAAEAAEFLKCANKTFENAIDLACEEAIQKEDDYDDRADYYRDLREGR